MSVTAQLIGFEACSEFSAPQFHNDTCGECAFLVIEHCKDGTALVGNAVSQVRDDMAAHGFPVNGGTTMGELVSYFTQHRGLDVVYTNHYGDSWDAIHQTLLDHAGRDGVVIEVEIASNLTGNEGGVRRHYIAIGGIHPTLGYLVANGDDVNALAQHHGHGRIIPTRWMDRTVIERAQPSACAIVRGLPHQDSISAAALEVPTADRLVVAAAPVPVDATSEGQPEAASEPGEVAPVDVAPVAEPVAPTHGEIHGYSVAGTVTVI